MFFSKRKVQCAVSLFVIFVLFGFVAVRAQNYVAYEYRTVAMEPSDLVSSDGYEVLGDAYHVEQEDPRLIYDLEDEDVESYGIRVTFEEAPDSMQVYFADTPDAFSEESSIIVTDETDESMEVVFGDYKAVRIDIDEDFVLSDIELLVDQEVVAASHAAAYLIVLAAALVLAVVLSLLKPVQSIVETCGEKIRRAAHTLRANWKRAVGIVIMLVSLYLVAFGIESMIAALKEDAVFRMDRMRLFYAVMVLIFGGVMLYKQTKTKPEHMFAFVAAVAGITMILVLPHACTNSWDDEFHYRNTAELSYGLQGRISYADQLTTSRYSTLLGIEQQGDWVQKVNEAAQNRNILVETHENGATLMTGMTYVPGAFGLLLGRAFGFSYTHTFLLGKLMILLAYILLFYLSIRMVRRGKILLCAIGLIPTNLFLAANYSYDWWLTGFVVLGYAMFICEIQRGEEHKISLKKWLAILLMMVLGILPKAVYFPLIFPMLFIGRNRFEKKSKLNWYWISDIAAIGILILSFILPMLLSGAGTNDIRGGSDVNSAEQISFILHAPLQYTRILLTFIKDYVSLDHSQGYLTFFAFIGNGKYFVLVLLALVVSAILEGKRHEKGVGAGFKVMLTMMVFCTISLVATALYISFTPVGYQTVTGCSPRYLLPLVFPVLYFLPECRVSSVGINKAIWADCVMGIMAGVIILNLYGLCVAI